MWGAKIISAIKMMVRVLLVTMDLMGLIVRNLVMLAVKKINVALI
jgi:hypothetical protein